MDPRVEEILLARAFQDAQDAPSLGEAAVIGSIPGALAGAAIGQVPHSIGRGLNAVKDNLAMRQGLTRSQGQQLKSRLKPGSRMAGGLVGAILGGGLGAGTRQMMIDNSPAASLLAKAQAYGGLNPAETAQLAQILESTYKSIGVS